VNYFFDKLLDFETTFRSFVLKKIGQYIDILNPVQPGACDMKAKSLKARFGERICFHGGIDEQYYLPKADMNEFMEEIKRVISEFAPNGGYILAPAHNIQSDTPPEKIIKLYETTVKYGTYPTKI
jgi:uroporphyrinogen decarboxylase